MAPPPRVQRASANDLSGLASDTPSAPMHVAAVLRLDRAIDLEAVRSVVSARLVGVPRLRQRLVASPLGGGRPVWVDDADLDVAAQVTARPCPAPGDQAALLGVAADLAATRLPRDRPLWRLTVVTDLADGGVALVLVAHHALSDGIGGLAVLASLMDGAPPAPEGGFPVPAPSAADLRADALRGRALALTQLPRSLGRLRAAVAELGVARPHRLTRCSLNQPTGPRRRLAVVDVGLDDLVDLAHRYRATVNDVLLTAVGGALAAVVRERGEPVTSFVISVPVSGRHGADAHAVGNHVGVMLVEVPGAGPALDRLAAVAQSTRAARLSQNRGASAPLLAAVFRLLARLGALTWFVDHQRSITTFATNVRGPREPLAFMGALVRKIVPITSIVGNTTVAFAALSYCGTLTVTLVADPDRCPELPRIAAVLRGELDTMTGAG